MAAPIFYSPLDRPGVTPPLSPRSSLGLAHSEFGRSVSPTRREGYYADPYSTASPSGAQRQLPLSPRSGSYGGPGLGLGLDREWERDRLGLSPTRQTQALDNPYHGRYSAAGRDSGLPPLGRSPSPTRTSMASPLGSSVYSSPLGRAYSTGNDYQSATSRYDHNLAGRASSPVRLHHQPSPVRSPHHQYHQHGSAPPSFADLVAASPTPRHGASTNDRAGVSSPRLSLGAGGTASPSHHHVTSPLRAPSSIGGGGRPHSPPVTSPSGRRTLYSPYNTTTTSASGAPSTSGRVGSPTPLGRSPHGQQQPPSPLSRAGPPSPAIRPVASSYGPPSAGSPGPRAAPLSPSSGSSNSNLPPAPLPYQPSGGGLGSPTTPQRLYDSYSYGPPPQQQQQPSPPRQSSPTSGAGRRMYSAPLTSTTSSSSTAGAASPLASHVSPSRDRPLALASPASPTTPASGSTARPEGARGPLANGRAAPVSPAPEYFNHVFNGIWIGSMDALKLELLRRANITRIVNAAFEVETAYKHEVDWEQLRASGVTDLQIRWDDALNQPIYPSREMDTGVAEIARAVEAGENILVNCSMGKSRSTSLVIAYLLRREGYTYDSALAMLQQSRPVCKPNSAFERQLRELEADVRARAVR